MKAIQEGVSGNDALAKAKKHYGRFENAAKYIVPRNE